jgi:hypothetical protein
VRSAIEHVFAHQKGLSMSAGIPNIGVGMRAPPLPSVAVKAKRSYLELGEFSIGPHQPVRLM